MKRTTTEIPPIETEETRDRRVRGERDERHLAREGEHLPDAARGGAREEREGRDFTARTPTGSRTDETGSRTDEEIPGRQGSTAAEAAHGTRSARTEQPGRAERREHDGPLLGEEHCRRFRSRWEGIQVSFIDEPRRAVADADSLVREATDEMHALFERDRRQLEGVWDRGDEVSTEDLRIALQRYRSFFERLLSI